MSDAERRKRRFATNYLLNLVGVPLPIVPIMPAVSDAPTTEPPMLKSANTWFYYVAYKTSVIKINIVDSYSPSGDEISTWAADVDGTGSIMCYVSSDYVLTIAGNGSGKILANPDSSNLFWEMTAVTEINGLDLLDTSNVTTFAYAFGRLRALTNLDLSHFNTSNVTTMHCMFHQSTGLVSLDVSGFDTSKVTTLQNFVANCSKLTSLDLSHFNTSNVTTMHEMFAHSGLTTLDISGFDTSKVTSMESMFCYCDDLISLDLSSFDTSNVTTMYKMFLSTTLSSLDLSNFDTHKVENMRWMFRDCTSLSTIYVGDNWTTENANTTEMFYNCGTDTVTMK